MITFSSLPTTPLTSIPPAPATLSPQIASVTTSPATASSSYQQRAIPTWLVASLLAPIGISTAAFGSSFDRKVASGPVQPSLGFFERAARAVYYPLLASQDLREKAAQGHQTSLAVLLERAVVDGAHGDQNRIGDLIREHPEIFDWEHANDLKTIATGNNAVAKALLENQIWQNFRIPYHPNITHLLQALSDEQRQSIIDDPRSKIVIVEIQSTRSHYRASARLTDYDTLIAIIAYQENSWPRLPTFVLEDTTEHIMRNLRDAELGAFDRVLHGILPHRTDTSTGFFARIDRMQALGNFVHLVGTPMDVARHIEHQAHPQQYVLVRRADGEVELRTHVSLISKTLLRGETLIEIGEIMHHAGKFLYRRTETNLVDGFAILVESYSPEVRIPIDPRHAEITVEQELSRIAGNMVTFGGEEDWPAMLYSPQLIAKE
ncbi:MAG: hypothetical protein HY540_05070 [Deltaproteobacteria bacterium]|nr:hypothetical protein [Deltaproteobacteria bacterium]